MTKSNFAIYPKFRPQIDLRWFWEFDVEKINWLKSYKTIIARILERGTKAEWKVLEMFYGRPKVINVIQHEIVYLPEYTIDEVCAIYGLSPESPLCSARKQMRPQILNA